MGFRVSFKRQKSRLASDLKSAATPSSIFKHYGFDESTTKLFVYKMAYVQLMCADDLQHRLKAMIDSGKLVHLPSKHVKDAYERLRTFNKSLFIENDGKSIKLLDLCDQLQEDNEFDRRVNEFIYQIELLNARAIQDVDKRRIYAQLVGCQAIIKQSMKTNSRYYIENDSAIECVSNLLSCAIDRLVPSKKELSECEKSAFDAACEIFANTAIKTFVFNS